jgi:hypothetical protein
MKLKNINLSFFILIGLMLLSFAFFVAAEERTNTGNNVFLDSDQDGLTDAEEKTYGTDPRSSDTDGDGYSDGAEVKAGYNPLKPAPGDKITQTETRNKTGLVLGQDSAKNEDNLTRKVSQKISELATNTNPEDQNITVEKVQSLINESMNADTETEDLPEIKDSDIKIKKQDYGGLSETKAKEKKKEDFIDYITAVFYIISSNSPHPLTSASDISSVLTRVTQGITTAMLTRSTSSLDDLSESGQKMLEQFKEVEVPQEMVSAHKKAMAYAMYSQKLKDYINPNPEDPVKDIANFSKMEALITSLADFSGEVEDKFTEYGIEYDETIKNKLKSYGIDPPQIDESTLKEITGVLSVTGDSSSDIAGTAPSTDISN